MAHDLRDWDGLGLGGSGLRIRLIVGEGEVDRERSAKCHLGDGERLDEDEVGMGDWRAVGTREYLVRQGLMEIWICRRRILLGVRRWCS